MCITRFIRNANRGDGVLADHTSSIPAGSAEPTGPGYTGGPIGSCPGTGSSQNSSYDTIEWNASPYITVFGVENSDDASPWQRGQEYHNDLSQETFWDTSTTALRCPGELASVRDAKKRKGHVYVRILQGERYLEDVHKEARF